MVKTSRAVIIIDDKLISIKREKNIDGKKKIYYTIPGGHVEDNETYEEAVIREVREELGIDVEIIEELVHIMNTDLKREEKFFTCNYVKGNIGTGNGPEWQTNGGIYGNYEIVYLDVNKINEYNLLPCEIKNLIKEKFNI